jgi:hypothetical protein
MFQPMEKPMLHNSIDDMRPSTRVYVGLCVCLHSIRPYLADNSVHTMSGDPALGAEALPHYYHGSIRRTMLQRFRRPVQRFQEIDERHKYALCEN